MNLSPVLETERLRLFELSEHAPGDTAFVLEMLNDPDFLRYIGDRGVHSLAQAVDYLRDGPVASYRLNGFGLYRVERREDGAAVGMCGLIKRPPLAHPDLGYALLPRFRGHGYVAEAARAVLAAARNRASPPCWRWWTRTMRPRSGPCRAWISGTVKWSGWRRTTSN